MSSAARHLESEQLPKLLTAIRLLAYARSDKQRRSDKGFKVVPIQDFSHPFEVTREVKGQEESKEQKRGEGTEKIKWKKEEKPTKQRH